MANNNGGFWFTTENGVHIYVEKGETPEEALSKAFVKKEQEYRLNTPYSEIIKDESKDIPAKVKNNKSFEEFYGEEFVGYKGKAAVEKILTEKRGFVKDAFVRSEVGGIDLVWGDSKGGVEHVIKRRDKMFNNGTGTNTGLEMVKKIPDIIENGEFSIGYNDRPNFTYDGFVVVVKPTYDGKKLNWVLSAMEIIK